MASAYGISTLSVIPGRAEPADASEQVTQLLFGEHYEVREKRKKWMRVRFALDKYECWIDVKQHTPIDAKFFERLAKQKFIPVSLEMAGIAVRTADQRMTPILQGSSLPFFKEGAFKIGKEEYTFDGHVQEKSRKEEHGTPRPKRGGILKGALPLGWQASFWNRLLGIGASLL